MFSLGVFYSVNLVSCPKRYTVMLFSLFMLQSATYSELLLLFLQ